MAGFFNVSASHERIFLPLKTISYERIRFDTNRYAPEMFIAGHLCNLATSRRAKTTANTAESPSKESLRKDDNKEKENE